MPLERLHPEEHDAAENSQRHEVAIARHPAGLNRAKRLDHRDARADQDEGHDRGGGDAEICGGRRPVGIVDAQRAVRGDSGAEGHRVAGQERPHPELAEISRRQRRFQLIAHHAVIVSIYWQQPRSSRPSSLGDIAIVSVHLN